MPIYEYRCAECHKRSSFLVLSRSTESSFRCSHCQSLRLERLLSRFASPKSEEARMESLADDSALAGLDENDPGSMERLMKRMGNEMGAEAGDDLEAMDNFDEGVGDRDGLDSL
ncbi:MAG TPA: zinc ribbon domain-containing protein [Nitrospira sp.]|nr:zinc ribbon domain-containing protein [Nitrospira sp.]